MSEGTAAAAAPAGGGTLLTEGPAGGAIPSVVPAPPTNGAEQAIQNVQDGPPEYIPPKFWDAEKRQPRLEDLGRSYINLEKLMGREKVPVPTNDEDEEGWQRWYAASGRPEKPEEYDFGERPKLPEDMGYDEEGEKFLREWAHKNGLNKRQTKNLYNEYAQLQTQRHIAWHEGQKQAKAEAVMAAQREFGQGFEGAKVQAQTVMSQYADPEFRQWLDQTGNGNDPRFFRFVARIGKDMVGDTRLKGAPQAAQPADLEKEISEHFHKNHAVLYDKTHPDHDRVLRERSELFERLHGTGAP